MIFIGADKHGYKAISYVIEYLQEKKMEVENLGVKNAGENIKLEELIPPLANKVRSSPRNKGILSCGTGVGVAVGADKFRGIRACLASTPQIAEWSVVYDKCNVLCLVGWECKKEEIFKILDAWFSATFDGVTKRLKMFEVFDSWQ